MTVVRDIVPSPDLIMGCKAVFGRVSSHVLCFAGRSDQNSPRRYYMMPAGPARRAVTQAYIIAVGGGAPLPIQPLPFQVPAANSRLWENLLFGSRKLGRMRPCRVNGLA